MSSEKTLQQRSNSQCELCKSEDGLNVFAVAPSDESAAKSAYLCQSCISQIEGSADLEPNHWRCLSDSMWNAEPAVQVLAWRMLKRLSTEIWAQDLLEMLYLEEDVQAWAQDGMPDETREPTLDSNGTALQTGDTVTIIKDLEVKGAGFTAKRGTAVRGISLTDNPLHIEGRVNGTRIVLVAAYLKKSN